MGELALREAVDIRQQRIPVVVGGVCVCARIVVIFWDRRGAKKRQSFSESAFNFSLVVGIRAVFFQ